MSTEKQDPDSSEKAGISPAKPKGVTETDLWDLEFDEDLNDFETKEKSQPKAQKQAVDAPATTEKKATTGSSRIPEKRHSDAAIQSKPPIKKDDDDTIVILEKEQEVAEDLADAEFDDLELEELEQEIVEPIVSDAGEPETEEIGSEIDTSVDKKSEATPEPQETEASATPDTSQKISSIFLNLLSTLSKTEKIGISALILILAIGAVIGLANFSKVPTQPLISKALALPIQGERAKVTSVSTFWREPISTGDNPDVVRRGTKLIPVITLDVEAKSTAIRVFFRNDEDLVIGDPINRIVNGKTTLTISATAGYNDVGMHTAYRTGETSPWIVQVFEAPSNSSSMDDFKKLLETEISIQLR